MARFFALVTAALAAATIVTGQVSSPIGNTFQPGRGAIIGTDLYYPDTAGHVILKTTVAGTTTIVAGLKGTAGSTEGNSTDGAARFNAPQGVCTDGTNLWVADTGNHKIRRIVLASGQTSTPYGPVAGTAVAGSSGDALGTASATAVADARFNGPTDCQFIGTADMYIADAGNNKIKKAVIASGTLTVLTGPAAGTTTSNTPTAGTTANNAARFNNPTGLCYDGTSLFVADTGNNAIRKVTPADGTTTQAFSGPNDASAGHVDAAAANAKFNGPTDCIATGTTDVLTVADKGNNALRRIAANGDASAWVGRGVAGDTNAAAGADAQVWAPIGLIGDQSTAAGAPTNVYVTEQFSRVRKVVYGTTAGAVTSLTSVANTAPQPNACAWLTDSYYCVDTARHAVYKIIATTGVTTVFAGTEGVSGDAEGAAGTGRLNGPTYIATDGTDFVVSDSGNHKLRRLVAAGTLSTPGGFGPAAGTVAAGNVQAADNTARWNNPRGLARIGTNVYVAETGNNRIMRIAFAGGAAATLFSGGPTAAAPASGDAVGDAATSRYNAPEGICAVQLTTTNGEAGLIVADTGNNKLKGITVGANAVLGFDTTVGTSVIYSGGAANTVAAADVTTAGTADSVRWNAPRGCAADRESGTTAATFVVVADTGNNKVKKVTLHATATSRTIVTLGAADGTTTAGNVVSGTANLNRFSGPTAIATRGAADFLIVDAGNRELKMYDGTNTVIRGLAAGILPAIGSATNTNTAGSNPLLASQTSDGHVALFNGPREAASLTNVAGVETGYLVDSANHVIRRVVYNLTSGVSTVSTFLGTPGTSGDVVTSGSVAFNGPTAIVANGTDTLYVADTGNHKIKKIVIAADNTVTVTSFAGAAAGDATTGAGQFTSPQGLAIAGGNLYVADTGSNKIKMITPAGVVSIAWGAAVGTTASGSADSTTAASNTFNAPKGLASNGTHIFVADSSNNKIRICTVGAGTCAVFAGPASGTTTAGNADTAPASFTNPTGVSFDQFGNLYVADTGNHKIRKITPAGVVTSVVGTAGGTAGTAGSGDQTTAASAVGGSVYSTATLNGPTYVWFARSQPTLAFIADTANNRVRVAAGLGTAAVTVTATATQTNTTTTTVTNTTTATVTTTANTTTAATTSTASNATTVAPTTTAARGSSNAVVAAATAVIVAVLAIFA